jgi:hypothetical protein
MKEQNIVCLIKYIQRSKSHANQFGDVINANIGYSFNVEAVYLTSQWSYLLKRGNTAGGGGAGIIGTIIAMIHSLSDTILFYLYSFRSYSITLYRMF